ncbi:hypothetical protein CJ030_MR6G013281 [Morella rubra]|uniref:Uncharacterized protein n=1 Tax=Morella rubra TaxID=262757 RepID=A0A6A1VF85_9ROSI|nr:hypothetical protein CJ030_MR6G013281 [Morella rubra]
MEVHKKKGGILLYHLAFLVMLILLDSYCCGAAVLVKSNSSFQCVGRLDECLIEDDLELEFLMNPYVSRILAHGGKTPPQSKDRNNPAFKTCGQLSDDPQYQKCIAKFQPKHKQCGGKGTYSRGCKPP